MSIDPRHLGGFVDEQSYLVAWFGRWYPNAPTKPVDVARADECLAKLTPSPVLDAIPLGQRRAWARSTAQPIAIAMGDVDP